MKNKITFKIKPQSLTGVKAIFCDIDGTLLDSKSVLQAETIAAVKNIKDKIPFYLISGRNVDGMRPIYDAFGLDTAMISSNGAMISTKANEVLYAAPIDKTTVQDFLPFVEMNALTVSLNTYTTWHWYCDHLDSAYHLDEAAIVHCQAEPYRGFAFLKDEDVMKIVLRGPKPEIEIIYSLIVPRFPRLNIIHYTDNAIEITRQNIDKGVAIKNVMQRFNIRPENAMSIGDSIVDMAMLAETGFAVVVRNANDELKVHAHVITLSNEDLGVATLLDFMVKL